MRKLTQILLLGVSRQTITLPQGESILSSLSQNPTIKEKLGRSSTLSLKLQSGSVLATASGQAYQLKKGMVLRLVYDDGHVSEWRISSTNRQHSGSKDFQVEADHNSQDLKRTTVRQNLVTGATRVSVGFYNMDVATIAGRLLSQEFNGPDLFNLGNVPGAITGKYNLVLNAATHLQALSQLCQAAEAEWDIEYQSGTDSYLVHFYTTGHLGGGEGQANKRPIGIGSELGNRLEIERKDETRDDFSRVIPISGQGTEIQSLAGVKWPVQSSSISGPNRSVTLKDNIIFKSGYGMAAGHDVYFAGRKIVSTNAPNTILVEGTGAVTGSGIFTIGNTTKELSFIEDPEAVAEIGVAEIPYNRPDISPYANIVRNAGISDDLSDWSSGMPIGFQKINGGETVEQEESALFVRHGSRSARVSADKDQGISTISIPISPSEDDPYFSSVAYLQVLSGSVRVEIESSDGTIMPDGQRAETNVKETRAIQIAGVSLEGNSCTIRLIAQQDGTVFFVDALTLTQSAFATEYNRLMGPADLQREASKYLFKNGGRSPDVWRGKAFDASYFFEGDYEEITIGSWVTVKEDFDGESFATQRVLRVIELEYKDNPDYGRQEKTVVLAEKTSSLSRPFTDTFLTVSSQQSQLGVKSVVTPSTFTQEDFEEIQFFWITKTSETVSGTIIQLPIIPINSSLFFEGLRITVVNPFNFTKHDFIVSEDQSPGDGFINIEQTVLSAPIPQGSYVFVSGFSNSQGIIEGRNFIRLFAMMQAIGEVVTSVDGVVNELEVNLFGYLSAGEIIHPADPGMKEPYNIIVEGEEGERYDSGKQFIPIVEQHLTIPAGTYIQINGTSLSSRFHIDPGKILQGVERSNTADAIGVLSEDRSGTITTISIAQIDDTVELLNGQKLTVINKSGEVDEVVIDGDQTVTAPTHSITIQSKELDHAYAAGFAWIREPSFRHSARLTIESNRINANIESINNTNTALAQAEIDMQAYTDGEIATASVGILAQGEIYTDNAVNSAVAGLATEIYVDGQVSSAMATVYTKAQTDGQFASAKSTWESYTDGEVQTAIATMSTYTDNELGSAMATVYTKSETDDEIQSASAGFEARIESGDVDIVAGINASADTINGARIQITGDTTVDGTFKIISGTSGNQVGISANPSDVWRIWSGGSTPSTAPFRVNRNGEVFATNLKGDGGFNIKGSIVSTDNPSGSAPDGTIWFKVEAPS